MRATLLLAAGSSSRMRGGDKLLEHVDGMSLLRRQTLAALSVGEVWVTMSPGRAERLAELSDLPVHTVIVENAVEGMGTSISAGVSALPDDCAAIMILPADMPDIDAASLNQIWEAFETSPNSIVRGATALGKPGHPVVFPRRLFASLRQLKGDDGAKSVITGEAVVQVALPTDAPVTDLDTPEAWAAWRSRQQD